MFEVLLHGGLCAQSGVNRGESIRRGEKARMVAGSQITYGFVSHLAIAKIWLLILSKKWTIWGMEQRNASSDIH